MIVDEVETELGEVQLLGDITQGKAILAIVLGIDVTADIGHLEHLVLRVQVGVGAIQAIANQTGRQSTLVTRHHHRQQRVVIAGVGSVAAIGEKVSLGEEGTRRVDGRLLPVPLVEAFQRQVVGQANVEVDSLHRHQYFLEFGAWQAELGGVDRVGGVDATAIEDALAPVEYLATDLDGQRHAADIPVTVNVSVENLGVGACAVARLIGEMVVVRIALARPVVVVVVALVHDLGVIEGGAAHEQAVVLVVGLQVRGDLEYLGNQAGIEVAIAVVAVGIVVGLVLALHSVQLAVGQRGIQRAGHFAVDEAELHRTRRQRQHQRNEAG